MVSDVIWSVTVLAVAVLAFIRSKQWMSGSSAQLAAIAAEQKKMREDYARDLNKVAGLVNDIAADMVKVKPVLPHYTELLTQFEEIKSTVSSLRTAKALRAVGAAKE